MNECKGTPWNPTNEVVKTKRQQERKSRYANRGECTFMVSVPFVCQFLTVVKTQRRQDVCKEVIVMMSCSMLPCIAHQQDFGPYMLTCVGGPGGRQDDGGALTNMQKLCAVLRV